MDRIVATPLSHRARSVRPASLTGMIALWRQRRTLARLSPDALCDMGLTAAEARAEAARPLWDVPAHWRG